MKQWRCLVTLSFFLVFVAACSHVAQYIDITKEKGLSGEYMQVLKRWTRSEIVYSQFETRAHISATLRGSEFYRAYLKEYANIYQLDSAEMDKRKKMQDVSEYIEFIFYAYIPNKAENDFERHDSIWSVFLINRKGEKILPVDIRKIEPVNALVTEFYPYVNPYYGAAYTLRFLPVETDAQSKGPFKLVFTSVVAKIELNF